MSRPLLVLVLAAGCREPGVEPTSARTVIVASERPCHERSFEGSRFTVCDPGRGRLALFAAGPDEAPSRGFVELAREIDRERVAFAMNAGMFDEAGRPIGLAIVDGVAVHPLELRDGPGNFYMKPNGVFMVPASGPPIVSRSDALPELSAQPVLATQSGPLLVLDGDLHPAFDRDGASRFTRNGVGVTRDGRALFVISAEPVSFGKLARFFRDELAAANALYFDGVVSSLWDPASGRQDAHSLLGPIVVAFAPEP